MFEEANDELELIFENGKIKRYQSFDEIREIANSYINNMKEEVV